MTISQIAVNGQYAEKQAAREQLAEESYSFNVTMHEGLSKIAEIPFNQIDAAMKRRHLTFEEAFVGTCYVLNATNAAFARATKHLFDEVPPVNPLIAGREFLNGMAIKEAWSKITEEEIAGMITAGQLDIVARPYFGHHVVETCGTGGDIGFRKNGSRCKTINVSTLSAIVLAALRIPAVKHGSYANTSALGSTDAIEQMGANVNQTSARGIEAIFESTGFYFSDAHVFKTIHDLSHLPPRHETINHLIGPMTTPISAQTKLNKVMGVSEKVSPEVVARAFEQIGKRGLQQIGNVAVVTGLDSCIDWQKINDQQFTKEHVILDELSPYSSIASFVIDGAYRGTCVLEPEYFGVTINASKLYLENAKEKIHRGNLMALQGKDEALCDYLALNAALGLYLAEYASGLRSYSPIGPERSLLHECFKKCRTIIASGYPFELLQKYIAETQKPL